MATEFLTLARAKEELRVTHAYEDAVITDKVAQATDLVIRYLDTKADPTWTAATVPLAVTAAILMTLEDLYVHRGADDWDQPTQTPYEHGYPAPRVRAVLAGLVKPLCV
jgi:Phage gp6-like head-tail connector protein